MKRHPFGGVLGVGDGGVDGAEGSDGGLRSHAVVAVVTPCPPAHASAVSRFIPLDAARHQWNAGGDTELICTEGQRKRCADLDIGCTTAGQCRRHSKSRWSPCSGILHWVMRGYSSPATVRSPAHGMGMRVKS